MDIAEVVQAPLSGVATVTKYIDILYFIDISSSLDYVFKLNKGLTSLFPKLKQGDGRQYYNNIFIVDSANY